MRQWIKKRKKTALSLLLAAALFVCLLPAGTVRAEEMVIREVAVSTSSLNVRSGPGTQYQTLVQVSCGTILQYIPDPANPDGNPTWYHVVTPNGTEGYVYGSYTNRNTLIYLDTEYNDYCAMLMEKGFPESYCDQLFLLHLYYPNWIFTPFQTGLKWDDVIEEEYKDGKSLINSEAPSSWKATDPQYYNWYSDMWYSLDSGGWVAASREIIRYYMDPRNCLGKDSVFQFQLQSFDEKTQMITGLRKICEGSFLEYETYYEPYRVEETIDYIQTLYDAGRTYGVNPYNLASIIILEQGYDGSGGCISGTNSLFRGYFNFFDVGAVAYGGYSAVENGLRYAMGGPSYGRPWNTRYKSIMGGTENYAENYVQSGQNTLYLKRFNVQGEDKFFHQYATCIYSANSEAVVMAEGYSEEMRRVPMEFSIPVYEDMPEEICKCPYKDGSPNNKLSSLSVQGQSLTPYFDTDTLEYSLVVPYEVSAIVISASAYDSDATISGTGTVSLNVGVNELKVDVTAENGNIRTYTLTVARQPGVAGVQFDTDYRIEDNKIISAVPVGTTVAELVEGLGVTGASVSVETAQQEPAAQDSAAATGMVVVLDEEGSEEQRRYNVVIYGDVNGDGSINGLDRFRLKYQVLLGNALYGVYLRAADVNRDGRVDGLDRFRLKNHVLDVQYIEQ